VAIDPEAFPHHFVIVGDVIYTIVTFHLPIPSRKDDKVTFAPFGRKRQTVVWQNCIHIVGMIVVFANAVAHRLDELVKEGKAVSSQELAKWVTDNSPPTPKESAEVGQKASAMPPDKK